MVNNNKNSYMSMEISFFYENITRMMTKFFSRHIITL